jgi:AcrR family transcriptional regulator
MKKKPEITEKTKQTIVDAFCELYIENPIEKISIQQIANKANYNRSTFYQYFSDIYELLAYVEDDLLAYIKQGLEKEQLATPSIVSTVLHCLDAEKYMLCLRALLGNYGSIHFLDRLKNEFFQNDIVVPYSKNNALTPYLIEFQISTAFSLFRVWIQRNKDLSAEEFSQLVHKLYKTGAAEYFD